MRALLLFGLLCLLCVMGFAQTKQPIQVKEWRDADLPLVLATLKEINDCGLADVPAFSKESPPTRAEAARICIGVYQKLKSDYDRLDKDIRQLSDSLDEGANKAALQALRDHLAAVEKRLSAFKNISHVIWHLRQMMPLLRRELVEYGLNDREVIKNLQDLRDRVSDPGCRWSPYNLFGYMQATMIAPASARGDGISLSGRTIERGKNSTGFCEALLKFQIDRDARNSFFADLALSNLVGNQALSDTTPTGATCSGAEAVWLNRLEVQLIPDWLADRAELNIGRLNLSISDEIFRKPYLEPLMSSWLENGKWIVDGLMVDYFVHPFSGTVFVGQKTGRLTTTSAGDQIEEMRVGRSGSPWNTTAPKYERPRGLVDSSAANMVVNDIAGAILKWKGLDNLDVEGRYLSLNSHRDALVDGKLANRLDIYSLEAKADPGDWTFDASYSQSVLMGKGTDVVNKENEFICAYAKVKKDPIEAMLEFRQIGANYSAPGDWGRIGMWWNPVDIEGIHAALKTNIDYYTNLCITAGMYQGIDDSISDWGHEQKVSRLVAACEHSFGNGMKATIEHEWVEYRDGKGPKPTENWTTVTFFYNISVSMAAQLAWQYGVYDSKGLSRFMVDGLPKLSGSTLVAQLMYKF